MKYLTQLVQLAHKFQVKQAGHDPKCRGCYNTNPWVNADKPDNTYFCRECRENGHPDPSPPLKEPEPVTTQSIPELSETDIKRAHAQQAVRQGILDYIRAYPATKISVPQLQRKIWESYVDAGGIKDKDPTQRIQAHYDLIDALQDMMDANPDVFHIHPGRGGGVLIDGDRFSAL